MDLYVLDEQLRRSVVFDRFISLIWTERYTSAGDFELKIPSTYATKSLFVPETYLAINESYRIMVVQTVSDDEDDTGGRVLTVTGGSFEVNLDNRVAAGNLNGSTSDHTWTLTGTPGNIARQIFQNICIDGKLSATDVLPFITRGTLFPPGTISEPSTVVTLTLDPTTVYLALKNMCEMYGFGFRLVRNFDTSEVYFEVYTGNDLTTSQNNFDAVVFSPGLDNLSGISELTSSANYKNVAYVISPANVVIVYAPGVDPTVSGFRKRILFVEANDVTAIGADSDALLKQRGLDALTQARNVRAFDGEISKLAEYKYGVDYNLGDLVEMRDDEGLSTPMRVTEHIYISDEQGDHSYPTLTDETLVTPGTWDSVDYNETWDEALGTWDDNTTNPPVSNLKPTPSFTLTRSSDRTTAYVDASSSYDIDGTVASYSWDFGDGTSGSGVQTSHTYTASGTYTVTLILTDNDGATSTLPKTITVTIDTAPPPNVPPTASFTVVANGASVSVNAGSSSDSDGSIVLYSWTFGDGGTATGVTANHTYASSNSYTIGLTVKDDDGATASTTKLITITVPPTPPTADFTTSAASDGVTVSFTAS